jgi:hypothetical protein
MASCLRAASSGTRPDAQSLLFDISKLGERTSFLKLKQIRHLRLRVQAPVPAVHDGQGDRPLHHLSSDTGLDLRSPAAHSERKPFTAAMPKSVIGFGHHGSQRHLGTQLSPRIASRNPGAHGQQAGTLIQIIQTARRRFALLHTGLPSRVSPIDDSHENSFPSEAIDRSRPTAFGQLRS